MKNRYNKYMASKLRRNQTGNAIVFLFAAIAMAGTVTYGLNNVMRGPAMTTNEVSRKTIAENNLIATSRLAVMAAATQQADGGDCDADGFVEPLPYRDAGVLPKPTGGGLLPMTMGSSISDPWGTQYGYCVWDPGTVSVAQAAPACGGATPRRLQGAPRDDQYSLAIISAGKNGAFETSCNAFVDTTPADGKPDTAMVLKPGGSDDIVLSYTYAEANGIGGGVWKLKDGDDTTAEVAKNVEVEGGATFNDGPLTLQNKGLVLPGDPGDDTVTGPCDEAKDQQLRRNIDDGTPLPVIEICDYAGGNGWIQVSSGEGPPIPPTQEIMELRSDSPAATDYFGNSVHVSGNVAIVGVPNDDDNGAQSGSAYIYTKSGGVWSQTQKLTASDAAAGDLFGGAVAVSGNFAIVGARLDDDGASDAGSAYIFVNSGGTWTQSQKIVSADPDVSDRFGTLVKITETTAFVGALTDDGAAADAGALYVFNRSGATWAQSQKLTASDATAGHEFTYSFDVSGSTLIVGARSDSVGGANRGAAYIFTKTAGTWTQTQKLTASDAANGDYFGIGVAVDGNTALVGAHLNAGNGAGYIFTKSAGTWSQTQKLTASDGLSGDHFAIGVDIEGSLAVLGANANDDKGSNSGSVYIFGKVGTSWTEVANLTASDGAVDDGFGRFVSLSADTLLVSSHQHDHGVSDSGSVYLFGPPGSAQTAPETIRTELTDPLDEGLVAHWKMDETLGTTVKDSVGDYDGTFINTPTWINGVKGAGALSFDMTGNDAVAIPTLGTAVYAPTSGTVAAWANVSSPAASGSEIFTMGGIVLRIQPNNKPIFHVQYAAGFNFRFAVSPTPLAKGWNYIVGTFDYTNDNIRIYANGVLLAETAFTDAPYYEPTLLGHIGKHPSNSLYDFHGGIDDIRLYDRALGPAEVAELSFRAQHESTVRPAPALKVAAKDLDNKLSTLWNTACAIKPDSTLWCWGQGSLGKIGNGQDLNKASPTIISDNGPWTSLSSGQAHTCGIKSDGSGWCWGQGTSGQLGNGGSLASNTPTQISGGGIWASIVPSMAHTCGIKSDGSGWCWGLALSGRLGTGNTTNTTTPAAIIDPGPWKQLATTPDGGCGIKQNSSAWCWGGGLNGELGNGAFGGSTSTPTAVIGGIEWAYIASTGHGHVCGIDTAGEAWCWGYNGDGQLGTGDTSNANRPTKVKARGPWVSISPGREMTCGIKIDGSAWCWGKGSNGKLGNGGVANQLFPVRVNIPDRVAAIKAGDQFACAMTLDGRAWCWGQDSNGQLGNGATLTSTLNTPYPVSNFPGASPWSWDDVFANITLMGNTTLGLNGYWMSDDGTANKYFGFQSKGRGVIRQNATNNQLLIETTVAGSSAQATFRAGNEATASVDYRPATLRADWLFNAASGTAVSSATGAHAGTREGSSVWNQTGGAYGASGTLEFTSTGLDRVRVPNDANLRPTSVSITTFVKPEGVQAPGATIISKTHTSHTGTPGQSYGLRFENGNGVSFVTGTAGALNVLGPVPIKENAWTHITAVYEGAPPGGTLNKFIYVNGRLVASSMVATPIAYDTTATGDLLIGAGGCVSMPCNNFIGAIDTTRIYAEALTAAQVYQIYKFQTSAAVPQTLGTDHTTNALEIGRNNAAADNLISAITPDLSINASGNVPIGSTTANSRVDVAGGVRIGYQPVCNAGSAGTIRNDLGSTYECTSNHNNFVARESSRAWSALASSADGKKLVAAVTGGQIYTSTDSGLTWTARESSRLWSWVSSSADGVNLAAVVTNGNIYTSIDSGATWTPRENNRNWTQIASSADGSKLAASVANGYLYTSTNSGVTWTARESTRNWRSVTSSADGTKLVALENAGPIYTSTDSGVTWTPRESNRSWRRVSSSADGIKLVAIANGEQIYRSTDSGVTWTPSGNNWNWNSVTSSADGTKLAATANLRQIYTSIDSGVTWIPTGWDGIANQIASSADGTKLIASLNGGQIYTSDTCGWKTGWATPRQTAMLTPSDPQASSNYGTDVAKTTSSLGKDIAIIGATLADGQGAAYAFEYSAGAWAQTQKIVSSDIVAADAFGSVSSIENDTIIIGAAAHDTPASNGGAAYVFTKSGATWTQTQKLVPSDPLMNKAFGSYISMSGNRAAISAMGDNGNVGAIYIFEKSGGTWTEQAKITPTGPSAGELFAQKVTLSGNLLVASAGSYSTNTGRAYIFERVGGTWAQTQTVQGTDTALGDRFGHQVAISGNDILIGAWGDDTTAGSAYVFQKIGGTWTQTQKLVANDRTNGQEFSAGMTVQNDMAVISAIRDDIGGTDTGSAYLFKRIGGTWTQVDKFTANTATASDQMGRGFAMHGDRVILGSHLIDTVAGVDRGAMYVFEGVGASRDSTNTYKYCDGTNWKEFPVAKEQYFTAARKTGSTRFSSQASHSCSINKNGHLWCWGIASSGRLGNGTTSPDVTAPLKIGTSTWTQITAAASYTCGIQADGTLWCWGAAGNGRLGNGTTSPNVTTPIKIGTSTWTQIAAGSAHSCGIQADGSLWCWGAAASGRLGNGTTSPDVTTPIKIGTSTWTQISVASAHSCGIQADGSLWCWGNALVGKLGNGTTSPNVTTPVKIGTTTWSHIVTGANHTCGIQTDGSLWCWGTAGNGRLGNGTTSPDVTAPLKIGTSTWSQITAGSAHTCGIQTDGSLWCWGSPNNGMLGNGTTSPDVTTPLKIGTSTWTQITAGGSHTCGVQMAGSLWCWGGAAGGSIGNGTTSPDVTTPGQVLSGY